MNINHAILHTFDFTACVNTFAEEEMDLTDKKAKSYVQKHANKALTSVDNMRGQFCDDSMFAGALREYFRGQGDFIDLSIQIAEFMARELGHMEKSESADLLVVDFEETPTKAAHSLDDEEIEAAYQARPKRYFALLLLDIKPAYVHETHRGSGSRNDVAYNRSVLPSPSQKVASYAVISADTLDVVFQDKKRVISGQEMMLIPDGLLRCTTEVSSKDAFAAVTDLVETVAQEYGQNTAVALSKAKAYASECPWDEDDNEVSLDLEELGRQVFEGNYEAQRRFDEEAAAADFPERVTLQKNAVTRVTRSHKIRTDTGIEITFPAEYGRNPEFMVFTSEADGTISIELKNIGHIENR